MPGIVNAGSVSINGSRLTALLSTTIVPMQGVTYTHTLQENDTFTIETPMSGYSPTFELWFTQPDTAVNFSFITNISWDDGTGHISSNNTRPPMNEANVTYCIVLRWTGTRWIGNLAYTEDISE